MFKQRNYIRDFVFPLSIAERTDKGYTQKTFLGSAFLFGNKGFALTAAHVIQEYSKELMISMFVGEDNAWYAFEILEHELHPQEDVAIMKIDGGPWNSPFRMRNRWEGSSAKYQMFGYPDDALYELTDEPAGLVAPRPDLIYTEGYIRRRLTFDPCIPRVKGVSFFELSEIAGSGCSGSPLYINNNRIWDVIGIYVGEKINDRGTSVSYAVREENFRNWTPNNLGTSILDESQNYEV